MLLELFPFVIFNNAMAFVYFLRLFAFCYESFIIDCYPLGVSNKHCLLSLFFIVAMETRVPILPGPKPNAINPPPQ